jgi:hypothetical protein
VNLAEGDVNKMKRKERKREWGLAMLWFRSTRKVKPPNVDKYRIFIQSTSYNRKLIKGQGFLYEVKEDGDASWQCRLLFDALKHVSTANLLTGFYITKWHTLHRVVWRHCCSIFSNLSDTTPTWSVWLHDTSTETSVAKFQNFL